MRNGENAALSLANHAAYGVHWHTDEGALASCEVDAYVWNSKHGGFDWSAKASRELATGECVKVRNQLECAAVPCGK